MTTNTSELKYRGMKCPIDNLGIVEVEAFIATVIRERLDYTKWQREYYDAMEPGEFAEKAYQYGVAHPYDRKGMEITV